MTDETTAPATDNQPPADDAAEKTEFRSEAFVNRLLDEKKKTQLKNRELEGRLQELEAKLTETENQKLIEKEDFKKGGEKQKEEADIWREKYEKSEQKIIKGLKAGSLKSELRKLGIKQERVELAVGLAKLDEIEYDSSTSVITGAEDQAKLIAEKSPEWFGNTSASMNSDAPTTSTGGSITVEEFRKLPLPEQVKRTPDLLRTYGVEMRK